MEHLSQKQVEDFRQSQLQVAELLTVGDHLAECETCRQQVQVAMNTDAAFFNVRSELLGDERELLSAGPESTHLTMEQMADYVDGQKSGEEFQIAEDHLSNCEQCLLAVDDLRVFRNEIAPSLDREYRPASVPVPTDSWWRRTFTSSGSLFRTSPIPAFSAAFGLIFLLVLGWVIWRRQLERSTKEEIAFAPAPSTQVSPSVPPGPSPSQPEPVSVVAQLKEGERVLTLDQHGNFSGADDLPPVYQSMLKKALATGRVEKSLQLNGLTRPGSSLMSSDKETAHFSVIEPGGNVLITDRPTFRWSKLDEATGYVVEVYDDKFQLISSSPLLTAQSWTTPQALSRGKVYSWQVKAIKEGQEITSPRPPAPQVKFRILDQGRADELSKAKRAYASSHLTLGLLYAEAGLLKEAEEELRAVQKANPDSEQARTLLRQVQALRRRSE